MFKEAYNYMFKDNEIAKKWSVPLLFLIVVNIITLPLASLKPDSPLFWLLLVLAIFFGMFFSGYACNCIKAAILQEKDENIVLPYLTLKSFNTGIKFFITTVAFSICFGIIFSLIFGLTMTTMAINKALFVLLAGLLLIITVALVIVFFIFFTPALLWIFSYTEKTNSFFKILTAIKIIKNNPKKYFLSCLFLFANATILSILYSINTFAVIIVMVATGKHSGTLINMVSLVSVLPYLFGWVYFCYVDAPLNGRFLTVEEFEKITAKES